MNSDDIALFLRGNPKFFDQHPELLEKIHVPHPHGGRAIPLSERQTLALREKVKALEGKLGELIRFGEENDAISEKVHRLAAALVGARDFAALTHALDFHLREDFAVPHVVLRVWRANNHADLPEFKPASDASREFAASLANPYCSAHAMVDTAGLFGEAGAHLRSFSYMPLRDSETFGLLALASEDPQRFYPEMGTLYLKRLGDLVSAAVARHLK